MSQTAHTFDPVWERDIYGKGLHLNRYPFDIVVTFVYRHYPRSKPRSDVRILELGCGAGNNLWFAAREGFQVAGIDGSESAIAYARQRFAEEGLTGDFLVGDFTHLPFEDDSFDLAIDRCSLTCCSKAATHKGVGEIWRVIRGGAKFLFNPYSDLHSGQWSGYPGPEGISGGTLTGVGHLSFYDKPGRRNIYRKLVPFKLAAP